GCRIQGESDQRRIESFTQYGPEKSLLDAVKKHHPIVDDIELDQQRGAAKNVGIKVNRQADPAVPGAAANGQVDHHEQTDHQRQKHQLGSGNDAVPVVAQCLEREDAVV